MKKLLPVFALVLLADPALVSAKVMLEIAQGATIPAKFMVRDAGGNARSYASITGRNGTVLVFTRSAKWCPFLPGADEGFARGSGRIGAARV